jgi:hypothetical protein
MRTGLHACYRNYDVVLKLLCEFDRRTAGTISALYTAAVTKAAKAS